MRDALALLIDLVVADSLKVVSLLHDGSWSPSALIPKCRAWYQPHDATGFGPSDMAIVRGKVIAGGRIALSAEIRRAQERLRTFAPDDGLISQELIAERRAEAARA
ncbi:hypothetical protein [Novosphingobium kaempferiae]|uniref:hypothetical protein n=1 Tax=Novosphingobium kaempferiae TaxID=2896849 RepID=UPI001E5F816E|nr:hypothetical protein [Novosphingobium kaempferiae]